MKDFFISYNQADRGWAEWIAWILEEVGFSVVVQAWDFRPGENFVLEMSEAIATTQTTIAVLSEDYLQAAYTQSEWAAAFANDPKGTKRKLIPMRVRACQPTGLLQTIVYVDLVGLAKAAAQDAILDALSDRVKPTEEPTFPGTRLSTEDPIQARVTPARVTFPGPPWMVPYERNVFFTGREQVLADLRQQLTQDSTAALSQTQAISGLGGIGKTQTAVEYAYRHRQDYQAVFWVRSETPTELITGFVEIARRLDLPQKDAQESDEIVAAVKRWLERNSNWLLIFDNADDPKLLKAFRPQGSNGHILLTSRAQVFGVLGITQPVALQKMAAPEAVDFLFKRTGRDATDPAEQDAATQLAAELDYLPLALEQAGAYIQEEQILMQDYLNHYQQLRLELLEEYGPVAGDYPESVATTWQLNFQQVEKVSPVSADILRISAFLSPDAIPYELLQQGASELGGGITTALADQGENSLALNKLLTPLARYSLIRREPESKTYSIYRLVQEVIKANLDEESRCLWVERMVRAVAQVFPDPEEYGNWVGCDRLLPHAQVAVKVVQQLNFEFEAAVLLLAWTGDYLRERGHYSDAEPLYVKVLELRKQQLGEENPDIALSLNNLAVLYYSQGHYNDAEPLYLQALERRKQLLGEEHPDVASSLNNLATLYNSQGRYSEAEPLLVQALKLRKRLLGEEHLDIAKSLNDLAFLYFSQGCYSEAEPLYVQALELKKRLLGEEHPSVMISLNNLAALYDNQGCYSNAEPLYRQALELRKRLLGKEHPDIATSLNNLAFLYQSQGRYEEAEPLLLDTVSQLRKLLGNEHPNLAAGLNNLARCYREQQNYSQAESLCQEALEIAEKSLPDDHELRGRFLDDFGMLRMLQGQTATARSIFQQAMEILEPKLGAEHPWTVRCRENLNALEASDSQNDTQP